MSNLLYDVSVLTDVSEKTLKKFLPVITQCVGHSIYEGLCTKQEIVEVDLDIGILKVKASHDGIHYKFVPSKELEKLIMQAVTTRTSPLLTKLENNLQDKIDRSYKELL